MIILNRACHVSSLSDHKPRPPGFDKEKLHRRIASGMRQDDRLIVILDEAHASSQHFVEKCRLAEQIVKINEGTESGSFRQLLNFLVQMNPGVEEMVYIVDNDFDHKPGWREILEEGIGLFPNGYVTLYDHPDKYRDYPDLVSKLFLSNSCWWRTVPSTTQTYAFRYGTLLKELDIHYKHSSVESATTDHAKWLELGTKGQYLISSIPAFSTHCEAVNMAPFFDKSFGP